MVRDDDGIVYESDFQKLTRRVSRSFYAILAVALLIGAAVWASSGLLIVEKGEAAVLIRKTGDDLPSGQILATSTTQKGIQLDPLPEGWHWLNPYAWDWEIVPQVEIEQGQVGIKVRNFGTPPPPGRNIAADGQKGVVEDTLVPGRYLINPYAYTVLVYPAVEVPAGHVGVVTLLAGRAPADPNQFLVDPGERGIQKHTVGPGSYYVNPFIQRIDPVDTRSHRFDMTGEKVIKFPSRDGFEISMEGTIEWYIEPARAPEVFVKYVDQRDVITCVVEKLILPYARAFSRIEGSKTLARDFISGETRQRFQDHFRDGLVAACAGQGIIARSVLVREALPPEEIARPIRMSQIAERNREKYTQEMERERQQKLLSMEEKMMERKTLVKQTDADVSVSITSAKQRKEVALIEASRKLEVAKLRLEAAENEAAATVAAGQAKADVIVYNNKAEAEGLRNAVDAFGDGDTYVRYLINQKLAPAYSYILTNTDGPFSEIFRRAVEESSKKKEEKQP